MFIPRRSIAEQLLVQSNVVMREEHHQCLVLQPFLLRSLQHFSPRLFSGKHVVEVREWLPIKSRVFEHRVACRFDATRASSCEEMPDAVLAIAIVIRVVLRELRRRFLKLSGEMIRDAESPVLRVSRGFQRDLFLELLYRPFGIAEEEADIAESRA